MSGKNFKREIGEKTEKPARAFNKKKWREQKYSNKAKVERFKNLQRKKAFRKYNKELKKSGVDFRNRNIQNRPDSFKPKSNPFKQALEKHEQILKEREEKRKERERIEKERSEAIKAYKEKRALRFRKLSQKTKKGQPSMKGRIELLLEKIEKEYANNKVNS